MVVEVPASEFVSVGFRPDWQLQSRLMSRQAFDAMSVAEGSRSRGAEGVWRVGATQGWQHRVRWSEALGMPARIESTSEDGRVRRVVDIRGASATAAADLPWLALDGYQARQYEDFMD